ncbi:GDP-L-fucose synthase [Thermodesulfovibrio sp. Kuro-1]|uniref:GDP-L-fucose synthase family protein n=1 Tax=Thermodesulfovibrio sp. Kuro-1 TaxID=2580394 RepID=UPI0011434571|nr:GDP-L-fucose synthase [Thermodesulfovibrio sp. Kuro-1]
MHINSKIAVLGASGLVGSAILRKLLERGYKNIIGTYKSRKPALKETPLFQVNLTSQRATEVFFETQRPDYVFLSAAKVGGILANNTYRADFIYENLAIAMNVIHSSYKYRVKKLLNLGSSCIYPKHASQPMKEEYLLTGSLEPTNEPYALAKISAIKLCRYYNEQYGTNFISLMPTNLYGPNDNFNLETSHALPALIRRFHLAKMLEEDSFEKIRRDFKKYPIGFGLDNKINFADKDSLLTVLSELGINSSTSKATVTLWGSGEVFREFLHVDDLADACLYVIEKVDAEEMKSHCADYFLNVGTGEDLKIRELAEIIKGIVGFKGEIHFDRTKPDGMPRKLLDVSKIRKLGWTHKISLEDGIKGTYEWYKDFVI